MRPDADLEAAQALGERLRAAVAAMDLTAQLADGSVTTSVGVTVGAPGEGASDLLRRADRALYQAKASGRNRVVAISPEAEASGRDRSPPSGGPAPSPRPAA
jgi:diguanylate cyclase (GGDEF)-like protein